MMERRKFNVTLVIGSVLILTLAGALTLTKPIRSAGPAGQDADEQHPSQTLSPAPGQQQQWPIYQEHAPITKMPRFDLTDSSTYPRMPLPPGEEMYGRLQGDHIHQFVEDIAAFSIKDRDAGNLKWGRIAGTANDIDVEDYIAGKFKQFGIPDVYKQNFPLPPQWFPTSWGLTATNADGKSVKFITARASGAALPEGGVDLDPVWVGLGTTSDFAGRDVKGKLAIIYSWPAPGVIGNSAGWFESVKHATEGGAAAVVLDVAWPGNWQMQAGESHTGIPVFTLGNDDTEALRAMMEKGPVKVHADYRFEIKQGLTDNAVWGILPGMSDENVIVTAHHDAYFTGASDNASGLAEMLALAEYFAKIPKSQRPMTIKFVSTASHHNGSITPRWMHDNRGTFLAKTALMLNGEHVSSAQTLYYPPRNYGGSGERINYPVALRLSDNVDARRWWVYGSDQLASIALSAYKEFGVTIYDKMETTGMGDLAPAERDAPSFQLVQSGSVYHTNMDTPEHVPAVGLETIGRAFAKIITEAMKVGRQGLLPDEMLHEAGEAGNRGGQRK